MRTVHIPAFLVVTRIQHQVKAALFMVAIMKLLLEHIITNLDVVFLPKLMKWKINFRLSMANNEGH